MSVARARPFVESKPQVATKSAIFSSLASGRALVAPSHRKGEGPSDDLNAPTGRGRRRPVLSRRARLWRLCAEGAMLGAERLFAGRERAPAYRLVSRAVASPIGACKDAVAAVAPARVMTTETPLYS